MGVPKDYAGKKYGMLTPIRRVGRSENGYYIWLCECECGKTVERTVDVFTRGQSSCGCRKKTVLRDMANMQISRRESKAWKIQAYR